MAKFTPSKRLKPQDVEIGQSIEIHANSLATFKVYVSRYNNSKPMRMCFDYGKFDGVFCKATRTDDKPRPKK